MMMIRCGVGCCGSWSIDKFGLLCTKKTSKKILMSLASTRGSSFFVFLAHNYCVAGHVSSTYGTIPYLCSLSRIIRLYNMFVLTMSADDTSTRSLQLWKKKLFPITPIIHPGVVWLFHLFPTTWYHTKTKGSTQVYGSYLFSSWQAIRIPSS